MDDDSQRPESMAQAADIGVMTARESTSAEPEDPTPEKASVPSFDAESDSSIVCPMCRSEATRTSKRRPDGYQLNWCRSCDLQFFQPMNGPTAAWYVDTNRERDLLDVATLNWNHRQFLRDRKKAAGRLLDIGCGTGGFLAAAQRLGFAVTGLDFDEVGVHAARERLGIDDVHSWSLLEFMAQRPNEQYDVVTAFEVLEHQEDPRGFIEACAMLVRPGGLVVVSVPFRDRWPNWNEEWDEPPHHFTRWSKRAVLAALSSTGLQPTEIRTGSIASGDLLMNKVRLGLVARELARSSTAISSDRQRLERRAEVLHGLKRRVFGALGAPVDVIVKAAGGTGFDMYIESVRPQ